MSGKKPALKLALPLIAAHRGHLRFGCDFRTFPVFYRLHPLGPIHEFVMGEGYGRMTNPLRIEFILNLQEPLVVVRTVLWTRQIEGLVRSQERSVKALL